MTRRTRIIRRIVIDEFGNERITEEEVPIEEIENPMEEDDEDQLVVVGAADESLESPKVQPLRFEARQVRSAHFEYKSDEEEMIKEVEEAEEERRSPVIEAVAESVPTEVMKEWPEVEEEDEVEFVPIVRGRVPSKRMAVRRDDEMVSKRQVNEYVMKNDQ